MGRRLPPAGERLSSANGAAGCSSSCQFPSPVYPKMPKTHRGQGLGDGRQAEGRGSPCRWEHGTRRRTTRRRLAATDGTVPGIAGERALGEGDRGRGARTPRPCQPMVGLGLLQAFLGGCHPCHRTRSAGGEKKPGRFSSGDRMGWESCRRGAAGWSGLLQIPKSPNPPKASCGNCSGAEDLHGVPLRADSPHRALVPTARVA